MGTQVMVTLSDEVYRRAEHLAALTRRDVADVIADTFELSLPPFRDQEPAASISGLSDEEVLELTELQMQPAQDRRLSELLHRQQAGELTEAERSELRALMQVYQEGLLRKAQALREAVLRGLWEPLEA